MTTMPSDNPATPPKLVVDQLMVELRAAFDLSTHLGEATTLAEVVERRIRSLNLEQSPDWGTDGSLTQVSKESTGALEFYYRPHLFPEMDPALRLGHGLQFDLLPRRLPRASPLRIAAVLESYCHLSGDLLGWRSEGDDLFLWMADVSGHGVRAGLAAATLFFLIDNIEPQLPLSLFAERVNDEFRKARNPEDARALFATAIWLRASSDGELRYVSSGHNPMLWLRASGEVTSLGSSGRPIGLLDGQTYAERELQLGPDDALCLFTDGLVEARNAEGEEFGDHRLASLWTGQVESPIALTRTIFNAVRQHRSTSLLDDDLTFMVIQPGIGV